MQQKQLQSVQAAQAAHPELQIQVLRLLELMVGLVGLEHFLSVPQEAAEDAPLQELASKWAMQVEFQVVRARAEVKDSQQ